MPHSSRIATARGQQAPSARDAPRAIVRLLRSSRYAHIVMAPEPVWATLADVAIQSEWPTSNANPRHRHMQSTCDSPASRIQRSWDSTGASRSSGSSSGRPMSSRNWRWSSGVDEGTTSRLAKTPTSVSCSATSLKSSRFRWSSTWWMENPATTTSNDPSGDSGSSRRHSRSCTRWSSPNRTRAWLSMAGEESTARTLSTLLRCWSTKAANLPSPQPKSSTVRGESGRTETRTSSPATLGANPPIRVR